MPARKTRGLDAIDVKILAALQRDGRMTYDALASRVGLTPRPCLERVRRLTAAGIVTGFAAAIDIDRLSRPVTVISEIALDSGARRDQVERRLKGIDEIVECWEVSGAFDYVARIVCADLDPLRGADIRAAGRGARRRPHRQPHRAQGGPAIRGIPGGAAFPAQQIIAGNIGKFDRFCCFDPGLRRLLQRSMSI